MFNLNTYEKLLDTKYLGREPLILNEVDSTNKWIADRLDNPQIVGMVALADKQTKGRGRRGRQWFNIDGQQNLAFSLAWRSAASAGAPPAVLTLAAGVAMTRAIIEVTDVIPKLKYPNDLLLNGKKTAGILTELKSGANGSRFAIIGVGVNVNATQDQFPDEIREIATSIRISGGQTASREAILAIFLNGMESLMEKMIENGPGEVIGLYKEHTDMFGRKVRITGSGEEIVGVVRDLDKEGGLVVETASGEVKSVVSGETFFI